MRHLIPKTRVLLINKCRKGKKANYKHQLRAEHGYFIYNSAKFKTYSTFCLQKQVCGPFLHQGDFATWCVLCTIPKVENICSTLAPEQIAVKCIAIG